MMGYLTDIVESKAISSYKNISLACAVYIISCLFFHNNFNNVLYTILFQKRFSLNTFLLPHISLVSYFNALFVYSCFITDFLFNFILDFLSNGLVTVPQFPLSKILTYQVIKILSFSVQFWISYFTYPSFHIVTLKVCFLLLITQTFYFLFCNIHYSFLIF